MANVKIDDGQLRGEIIEPKSGGKYYSFKGIPFAEPPLGDLRFRAPQPVKPWSGVRSATEHGPVCKQFDLMFQKLMGSEDCLYLNVYSPNINNTASLPVMVWIHGGAFLFGSGNSEIFNPEFLVQKEVVVVTINYRVGAFGFLCLDTEDIPGNAGMKDQVAALKWVKNNITNFGGDPDNVTVFGQSAGGISIGYHLISPMSKGLFRRAIIQSGATTMPSAYTIFPRLRAINIARHLGKDTEDIDELCKFFKTVPADSLLKLEAEISVTEKEKHILPCTIVNEKRFGDNERFFYNDRFDIHTNGIHENVEVIIGYTKDEGTVSLAIDPPKEDFNEKANNYAEILSPSHATKDCNLHKQMKARQLMKDYYFGKEKIDISKHLKSYMNFLSMDTFTYDILQLMKTSARNNKVFSYKFSLYNDFGKEFLKELSKVVPKGAVAHGDEIMYMFKPTFLNYDNQHDVVYKTIERMTTLWTNFAKYGNPTPDDTLDIEWTPFTLAERKYLDITETLDIKSRPNKEELELWERVFEEVLPEAVSRG